MFHNSWQKNFENPATNPSTGSGQVSRINTKKAFEFFFVKFVQFVAKELRRSSHEFHELTRKNLFGLRKIRAVRGKKVLGFFFVSKSLLDGHVAIRAHGARGESLTFESINTSSRLK